MGSLEDGSEVDSQLVRSRLGSRHAFERAPGASTMLGAYGQRFGRGSPALRPGEVEGRVHRDNTI